MKYALIKPGLTPLAAAGLIIIMIGATAVTFSTGPAPLALAALNAFEEENS